MANPSPQADAHGRGPGASIAVISTVPKNPPLDVSGVTSTGGVSSIVGHYRTASDDTAASGGKDGTVAGRKITTNDVQNVFRGSTTTGIVSQQQIQRIKRMHDKISDGVRWDFNYSVFLLVSSIVAGIGLATDSATTVISSMLLSPIMGPVIGMAYGLVIWDWPLIKRSARHEILSIVCCIVLGLIIGACCSWTRMATETWPTHEMWNRATRKTFLSGFPVAFFSGFGVALSVLDDQTSSLVGVAISASLLPPAVNSGMLWVMAMIAGDPLWDFEFAEGMEADDIKGLTANFSQMGVYSLLLTIANVVCVAAGACLMFRLKEVLPVEKKVFWEDLKVARRIYQGRALESESGETVTPERAGISSERTSPEVTVKRLA